MESGSTTVADIRKLNEYRKKANDEPIDMRDFPFESLPEVVVFRILDHLSYDQVAKMRIIDS